MTEGIYEELVTQLVSRKIGGLDRDNFYIKTSTIDKEEAADILSKHLSYTIKNALNLLKSNNSIESQIEVANKIILFLKEELRDEMFDDNLIDIHGKILKAVFSKIDTHFSDLDLHLKEITPYTRLTHSELFTGGNIGLSLESELKKEIISSNKVDLLVSFIKFKGIIILKKELEEFTKRGGHLRVITTTYMGASDYKAIKMLSELENTQVKVSYNSGNERLHAKAYLFKRDTGFHTGYIGSSNFSRSALTDGLEWNLKVTTKEVSHIIDKFQKTFDSYWQNDDFELFDDQVHKDKLIRSLNQGRIFKTSEIKANFFDIRPYPFQKEILEKLEVERSVHNRYKNLVVAATGTGKTIISAFDYKRFRENNKSSKLLFLAHRREILEQSLATFRGVLRDNNFGELWLGGSVPDSYENVFASVQTLNNQLKNLYLLPTFFDYIVIDECHHLTANSYRGIIEYFKPKVLLGLTATPERMDGSDIQEDFHNRIAAEIRLPEALNRKLLSPFQYFGISDSVDLLNVRWEKGRYVASELSSIYTRNDRRVGEIIDALETYTKDSQDVRALGFCITMDHARFMAEKFTLAGFKADYLTSDNTKDRDKIKDKLLKKEINYLFVVDIFNEGVDISEIDTVLFLRPTESLTIFLQQLGRGLRLAENKDCLTVLDFVGNARPEYNFENKFRALIGKTTTTVKKEIEDNFPHLPLGCSIILEKKAKQIIIDNISAATTLNKRQLIMKIQAFKHDTTLELSLKNFIKFYNIPIQLIYKHGGWKRLCQLAGTHINFSAENEDKIVKAISNRWLSTSSTSYFKFIFELSEKKFNINIKDYDESQKLMLMMLHYDIWIEPGNFNTLEESIRSIGNNEVMVQEIKEFLELTIDEIGFKEIDFNMQYSQPLKIHSRYTRDQILSAFRQNTFNKKSSSREGVVNIIDLNTELLFVTLHKSEEDYSPTTMYDDYAINETLFHWQSQNSASPSTPKGISYIEHEKNKKRILLFVREKDKDEFRNTMGYVFVGEGKLRGHYGAKPMSIEWELNESIPNYLWHDAAKLRIG